MLIIIEPRGGLTNRMRVIASALHIQKLTSCELQCVWNQTNELNAPFDMLFEPIEGLTFIKSGTYTKIKSSMQENCIKKLLVNIFNKLQGIGFCIKDKDLLSLSPKKEENILNLTQKFSTIYIATCEEFGNYLSELPKFIPIQNIRNKIIETSSRFNRNAIGIHIRRTDNQFSIAHSPTILFINAIEREITQNNNALFFLSTDDSNLEKELIKQYDSRIIVVSQKSLSRRCIQGIQDAVVDLFCLAHTSKIYGSYWSSFSGIAAELYNIELTILNIDHCNTVSIH